MARNRWSVVLGVALAVMVWSAGAAADVVSDWVTLGGGGEAKVVYWQNDAIRVMDLTDGSVSVVVPGVPRVVEVPSGKMTVGPYPVWSPDGTKISYFRGDSGRSIWVVNENGTNLETVISSGLNWDYGVHSWWSCPTVAGDWIVAQKGSEIVRVEINADNTPGATVKVMDMSEDVDWLGMSGDYVGFTDWSGHTLPDPDLNTCIAVNWKTLAQRDVVALDKDACSMNMKQDGSGTCVYCPDWHGKAQIQTFGGTILGDWIPVDGGLIEMLRWSNDPDYICHMDNRQLTDASSQRAWIRTADADGLPYMLLGSGMWGPDLWVQPNTITVTSPDGGETWIGKGTEDVTWTTQGTVGDVKIELSTNGGASWTTLVASTSTGSPEPVTVPDDESTQSVRCRVRVSELDGSPTDTSNADFTIVWADTDGDEMPDWWEEEHFSNATAADPAGDEEPDGLENLDEYLAGSDPHEEDTDGDGILDGVDGDPAKPASPLTGGCSPGGGGFPAAALALLAAAAAVRGRRPRRERDK